ncbi:ATP-dependent DNA helicase RecG [Desulfobotulus alkaliphilus]|uniref:ATP-dependent DNA helicase RecG n=1 Tax=Desulfobotulus alkaliphilus TaxID=622671 RepID=A0A562QWW7_9BACT|nr:ATP-dependent DNA helicase RecG [Desulfobotulus alkaliphilus]
MPLSNSPVPRAFSSLSGFSTPYDVLWEIVLNVLVHRDYGVPAPIQIRVYEHKMKIWNPAVLPEEWTLETLYSAWSFLIHGAILKRYCRGRPPCLPRFWATTGGCPYRKPINVSRLTAWSIMGSHASQPYNPDLANAFFRSGEIESWGRGIEWIFSACRNGGSPTPTAFPVTSQCS